MEDLQEEILKICCSEIIIVSDKVTFDSEVVDGVFVTYWMDYDDMEERINKAFDILFEEVIRNRVVDKIKNED